MVEVNIALDRANSSMFSFDALHAPNEMLARYNDRLFSALYEDVNPNTQAMYQAMWTNSGIDLNNHSSRQRWYYLFNAEAKTIEDNLTSLGITGPIAEVIRNFDNNYDDYFKLLENKFGDSIAARQIESSRLVSYAFEKAQEITGLQYNAPDILQVHLVEGISPSALGGPTIKNYAQRVAHPAMTPDRINTTGPFLNFLVHEGIGHKLAMQGHESHRKYFDLPKGKKMIYPIEEAFVKNLSEKIEEIAIGEPVIKPHRGQEQLPSEVFKERWSELNGNFLEWYDACVKEIKDRGYELTPGQINNKI